MNQWSQKTCRIAVLPHMVREQNLLLHCPSSKSIGLLHFTPCGHLIFGLKSPKAICYQQLREDRVACWWETRKHSSSWENSVFCEAGFPNTSKRQQFALGSRQPISSRRGGRRQTPLCPAFLLVEFMETETEIAEFNYTRSWKTPRFISAHQYWGREQRRSNHSRQGDVWHSQVTCFNGETCRKADETETKARRCTKSHTVVSLEW